MPCVMHDWEKDILRAEDASRERAKLDAMANMLCRTLRAMPTELVAQLPPDILAWWDEHKAFDASQGR